MFTEQANGHLEAAADGYKNILKNLDETKSDAHFREFIFDQLTLCLANAEEWHNLLEVTRAEESRQIPRATIPILSFNSKQIEQLIEYRKSNNAATLRMSEWETLNSDLNGDFSYHRLISLTENTICNTIVEQHNQKIHRTDLDICFAIVQSGLQECLRTRSHEHLNNFVILNYICQKIAHQNTIEEAESIRGLSVDKSFGAATLSTLLYWSDFYGSVTAIDEQMNLDLRLDVCSMTRKEGNLTHCKKQLEIFFEKINFATQIGCTTASDLNTVCQHLIENNEKSKHECNIWNKNTVRGVYEAAKWLYNNDKKAAIQLAAANAISISNQLDGVTDTEDEILIQQRIARTFITLAEWLQNENDQFLMDSKEKPIGKLIESLETIRMRNGNVMSMETNADIASIISPIDVAIGKLLSRSVQQCPTLSNTIPKAYGAYGNWCYRWGRRIVEMHTEKDEKAGLRSNDLNSIKNLIPNARANDIELISNVLDLHKISAEDDELVSSSDDISSTELIESQLRQVAILSECSSEMLHKIIEIWRNANKNIYVFYEMAAEAYFKYLQLATQMQDDSVVNVSNTVDDGNINENCSIVTATLRILRLIVKHALGLQEVLEQGLETTPTSPWKVKRKQFQCKQFHCNSRISPFSFLYFCRL